MSLGEKEEVETSSIFSHSFLVFSTRSALISEGATAAFRRKYFGFLVSRNKNRETVMDKQEMANRLCRSIT